jgi:Tol biopolymer transport system component
MAPAVRFLVRVFTLAAAQAWVFLLSACGGGGSNNNIQPPPTAQTFAFLRAATGGLFQPMAGNLNGAPFKAVGQPANIWSIATSPDGKKAVFDMNANGQWDIYVADTDGTNVRQITNDAESDYEPTFSPDGSKVIFTSYRGDQGSVGFDVIVANVDGTGITDLTQNSTMDHHFAVSSPDGTWIAFAGVDRSVSTNLIWGIWVMGADGSSLRNVLPSLDYDRFSLPLTFSPDSTKIFFSGTTIDPQTSDIYSINLDGSNLRNLTNTGTDWYPRFDGSTLIFNSYRDGNAEIYAMNADGTGVRRLTTNTVYDSFSQAGSLDAPGTQLRYERSFHFFSYH